jgi:hypothetical protein
MRSLAATLRGDATTVGTLAHDVGSRMRGMTFQGPAANRIRGDMSTSGDACSGAADRLNSVADSLETAATEVERQQADRLRRLDEMRRELEREKATR